MKKYIVSLLAACMVLVVPMTSLASSCGYYEYYTDYKKVSSYEPVSRYVCDDRGWDYYRGRDCYYTTEYVKTYKYKPVQKKRWVDKACYYPTTSYSYERGYDNGYYDGSNGYSYSPYTYNSSNYSNYYDRSYYGDYYGNYYSSYYGYSF